MDSSNTQPEGSHPYVPKNPAIVHEEKKTEDATFVEDVKDHIDEFINASMDDNKTCFKKTRRCLGCRRLLRSSLLRQRKLKSKVCCLFRPMCRSTRMVDGGSLLLPGF